MTTFLLVAFLAWIAYLVYANISAEARKTREAENVERIMHDQACHTSHPDDWAIRRNYILRRDKYACQKCGSSKNLQVHHKVRRSVKADHSSANLITLCVRCHASEDGHNDGLVEASRATILKSGKVRPVKSRKVFHCDKCHKEMPKGSESYVCKPHWLGGRRWRSGRRYCRDCMIEA